MARKSSEGKKGCMCLGVACWVGAENISDAEGSYMQLQEQVCRLLVSEL